MKTFARSLAALLAGLSLLPSFVAACPFCTAPSLTLSEQASQSDVVLLAEWKEGTKDATDDGDDTASTTFEVKKVLKGSFEPGQTIKQVGYQPGEKGELFLLTGLGADVVQWDIPTPFSEKAFDYLAKAPPPQTADGEKVPYRERLPYFVKYLEFPDETVANDAYGEFANAPYEEIVAIKETIPREKVRGWVLDPATPPARLGLYGLLLGLSGIDEDATAMEELIAKPTDEFRIGLDGVMSGYLLLKKEPGLDLIRELKLENEYLVAKDGQPIVDANGEKVSVPFSETYAAMQAVRFMWDYGGGAIGPEPLRAAMRVLLDRPELADLAIADLARWKDWSVLDRLAKLYDEEAYQVPGIKRSIIRYFDAATKDLPKDVKPEETEKHPGHVKRAREHYAAIKAKDPETVKSVEQFLILLQ
ncbi:MAG TPA: hypothetical protein VF170_13850 [Planctomycetaceae bacterium]